MVKKIGLASRRIFGRLLRMLYTKSRIILKVAVCILNRFLRDMIGLYYFNKNFLNSKINYLKVAQFSCQQKSILPSFCNHWNFIIRERNLCVAEEILWWFGIQLLEAVGRCWRVWVLPFNKGKFSFSINPQTIKIFVLGWRDFQKKENCQLWKDCAMQGAQNNNSFNCRHQRSASKR